MPNLHCANLSAYLVVLAPGTGSVATQAALQSCLQADEQDQHDVKVQVIVKAWPA